MSIKTVALTVSNTVGTTAASGLVSALDKRRKISIFGAAADSILLRGSADDTDYDNIGTLTIKAGETEASVEIDDLSLYYKTKRLAGTSAVTCIASATAALKKAISVAVPAVVGDSGASTSATALGRPRKLELAGTAGDQILVKWSPDDTNYDDLVTLTIKAGDTSTSITLDDPAAYYKAKRLVGTTAATLTVAAEDETSDAGPGNTVTQDGNSFGATMTIGTNDAQKLALETNNTTRITIGATGLVGVGITTPLVPLHVNVSTGFGVAAVTDKASGGAIGTAAATVDAGSAFAVNQTTTGQDLTLPAPTVTTAGRIAFVENVGTASFTLYGARLSAGYAALLMWNGSAWILAAARFLASVFEQIPVTDKASGGNIGTAAATVDIGSAFNVNQTTAGQDLTLPNPTDTTPGRMAVLMNGGSASFTAYGARVMQSTSIVLTWKGSAWTVNLPRALDARDEAVSITDKASGGNIGTAAATVDVASVAFVNQTTAAQTLTLPTPTVSTAGKRFAVVNVGSQAFTLLGIVVAADTGQLCYWAGAAWKPIV